MSIGGLKGPDYNVDTTQIGVPVVTPRKERPSHKRSLTGKPQSTHYLGHVLISVQALTSQAKLELGLEEKIKNGHLAMSRLGKRLSKLRPSMAKILRQSPTVSLGTLPPPWPGRRSTWTR
jgi:hypothetical protein